MKKLTATFWLAIAAAGILALQAGSTQKFDDPIPTCPPTCERNAR